MVVTAPPAAAAWSVTHTYDEFWPDSSYGQPGYGAFVGTFYPGFDYTGNPEVYCSDTYFSFVPQSTLPCAVYPHGSFKVTITSTDSTFDTFSADFSSDAVPDRGMGRNILLSGFDALGVPVAVTTCAATVNAYVRCEITGSGMSRVEISGDPYYMFDTATFSNTASPVFCEASSIEVMGSPSTHGADYDGATTTLRLSPGAHRVIQSEAIDAPTAAATSHNDAGGDHTWTVTVLSPGIHRVSFQATSVCPSPYVGEDEALTRTYTQWASGSKCAVQGTGDPPRFVLGFGALPPDLSVGSVYDAATVVHVNSVLGFIAVTTPLANLTTFTSAVDADASVQYCELDGVVQAEHTPDDPNYGSQYGLERIHAPAAWDTTLGTTAKTVCVVDTGVRYTHEDLAGARWLGGVDYVNGDGDPWDDQGHGTHVAGIAVATTDNGLGVAGVAQAGLKAAKVLDASGSGYESWVASGIQWCADHGGNVISLSLGGSQYSSAEATAVAYAWNHGALVVAATGNNGCIPCVVYPAKFPNVIAVGCTTTADTLCPFSNGGPEIALTAPGYEILSTCNTSDAAYCTKSGTSMSTPHVSGVAALVWSRYPTLTNAQLREYLLCSARDLGPPGWDEAYGEGIVDAAAALADAAAGSCGAACTGDIQIVNADMGNVYYGPAIVKITHTSGGHPWRVYATAQDGSHVDVVQVKHDVYEVDVPDTGTRRITLYADLSCGTTLTKSFTWVQWN